MMLKMRYTLMCLAVLLLTSCIPVEDWGGYWDKGTIDKDVLGTWQRVAHKDSGDRELVTIVNHKGTYRLDSLDPKDRKQKDYQPLFAKTLKAGGYTFLMTTQGAGDKSERNLVRYQVKGGRLTEYDLSREAMEKWVRRKYLWVKNLDVACPGKCMVDSVRIKVLDQEVFDILAAIPNTVEFWKPLDEWRRTARVAAPRAEKKPAKVEEQEPETSPAPPAAAPSATPSTPPDVPSTPSGGRGRAPDQVDL